MAGSGLLRRDETLVLMVDVQGRLSEIMTDAPAYRDNIRKLLAAARVMAVPVLAAEQLPEKLGPTAPELAELVPAERRVRKSAFSCWGEPALRERVAAEGRRSVLVTGIEAHVCVSQTVHDLLSEGYAVQVAVDAVSSRRASDRDVALERMRTAGATLTTVEAAVFELLGRADAPEFKEVHRLLK
jgi:nicotinamidase-related amidase